jgi:hypothetical protein
VDTAESYEEMSDTQTEFVREWFDKRDELYVRTIEKGPFGRRWIGDVFIEDEDLAAAIIEEFGEKYRYTG